MTWFDVGGGGGAFAVLAMLGGEECHVLESCVCDGSGGSASEEEDL